MQSGVPTKVFLSLPGGAMQSNGGEILVGADVSKAWIDVCRAETTRVDRIANTPEALAVWVARARPTLVAMEPTGGYERALCLALAEAGVRLRQAPPQHNPRLSQGARRARQDRSDRRHADRPLSR
jgi:transposase